MKTELKVNLKLYKQNIKNIRSKLNKDVKIMAIVKDFDLKELFKAAQDIPEFKGIGLNITENYVHVDTRKQEDVSLWVEENDKIISLTEENMSHYFGS